MSWPPRSPCPPRRRPSRPTPALRRAVWHRRAAAASRVPGSSRGGSEPSTGRGAVPSTGGRWVTRCTRRHTASVSGTTPLVWSPAPRSRLAHVPASIADRAGDRRERRPGASISIPGVPWMACAPSTSVPDGASAWRCARRWTPGPCGACARSCSAHRAGAGRPPGSADPRSPEQPAGEDQQAEAEEVEREDDPEDVAQASLGEHAAALVPALDAVVRHQHGTLVEAVHDVLRLEPVPAPHQAHRQQEPDVVRALAIAAEPLVTSGGQHEAHVDVVAQPPRERDVPAIPHLPEVAAQERGVEVLRHADAEEMPDADGEGAVPGEVEEEIHAERVHVADPREEPVMPSGRHEPLLVATRG